MRHLVSVTGDAVGVEQNQFIIEFFAVGGYCPALAGGHGLDRVEAESGHIRQAADGLAFIESAYGVGGILYQRQVILPAYGADFI